MPPKPPPLTVPDEPSPVPKAMQKQANKIVENWTTFNPGGAPVSPEFVIAALQQGLNAKEVKAIIRSQALGGPRTSADFSSPELLDYFTQNPGEIRGLLDAVRSTRDQPDTYAEYLARGGEPGGYRSQGQLLQEAVLGIGGARDAYLAGTHRAMFEAEGNDPRRWYIDGQEWMEGLAEQDTKGRGKDASAALAGVDDASLQGLSDAASKMLQARSARQAAQSDYFGAADLSGEEL